MHNVPGGVYKAAFSALKRAGDTAKTRAGQFAAAEYTINKGDFMRNVHSKSHITGGAGGVMGMSISFSGTVLPLLTFNTTYSRDGTVQTQVKRNGGAATLQHAFVAKIFGPTAVFDGTSATKKAPYVLHQIITGMDQQPQGQRVTSSAKVRSICCVYNDDEQEGGLMLLNLMERIRVALLRQVVIGEQFTLDLEAGLEVLVYPDDTAPYFVGEMISTWILPPVEREVNL